MQPACCAEIISDPGRYSTAVSKTDPTSDVFVTHRRIIPAGSLVGGGTTCFVLLWGFSQEIETPDYYSHTHTHILHNILYNNFMYQETHAIFIYVKRFKKSAHGTAGWQVRGLQGRWQSGRPGRR